MGFNPPLACERRQSLDSGIADVPVVANITVINENDPPSLDADFHFSLTGVYILDSIYTNFGDTVASILYGGYEDIDGANVLRGVAVIDADQSKGVWEWSKDGGLYWTPFGRDLAPDRPLLLHAGTLDRVRYRPTQGSGIPMVGGGTRVNPVDP